MITSDFDRILLSGDEKPSLIDRVHALLAPVEVVEEEAWLETHKVPLFRFGAPAIRGARVEYSECESVAQTKTWLLRCFAVGNGRTATFTVENKRAFIANPGECLQVFVPVDLRIARVSVSIGAGQPKEGVRAEVVLPEGKPEWAFRGRGCHQLEIEQCRAGQGEEVVALVDLRLRELSGGSIQRHEERHVVDVAREVSINLKRVGVTAVAQVRQVKELRLAMDLTSGHDYLAYLCKPGLLWKRP